MKLLKNIFNTLWEWVLKPTLSATLGAVGLLLYITLWIGPPFGFAALADYTGHFWIFGLSFFWIGFLYKLHEKW